MSPHDEPRSMPSGFDPASAHHESVRSEPSSGPAGFSASAPDESSGRSSHPAGLSVAARIADRELDLALELAPGEVLAVLGPNGAGKSSLLQVIAGLLVPDEGHVRLGADTLTDTAKAIALAPYRRGISLLAQEPLLFPHLTVAENVAFGPRSRGNRQAKAVAAEWLRAVDATHLADRHPAALSGGQAQRVALARALAVDPHLLLLDEPMSALDVDVAPAMRSLLRRVLRDPAHPRCAVLVTHDIIDAITLADRIVIVESGRIVESGQVTDVMSHPRSPFAARIAGLNLLHGTATAPRGSDPAFAAVLVGPCRHSEPMSPGDSEAQHRPAAHPADRPAHSAAASASLGSTERPITSGPGGGSGSSSAGGARHSAAVDPSIDDYSGSTPDDESAVDGCVVGDFTAGTRAAAVFSPAAVSVFTRPPGGSPRNVFTVDITEITDRGGIVRVRGDAPNAPGLCADLTPAAVAQLGLAVGTRAYFAVKATEVRVYAC
ncbi:sulfate/molybdate ABC transporter ATP-binding protein [Nocardia sp. GTS18]|uniref:sulfate/molybdate ABC transporter ATP-binding protein n=1 Tax=Nocardia sp. GTS18 TaxID=1778064 RepID=UPI00210217FF|nr:ATP-binding cassette domain-containing protein [Nocardia sp. GTS18]